MLSWILNLLTSNNMNEQSRVILIRIAKCFLLSQKSIFQPQDKKVNSQVITSEEWDWKFLNFTRRRICEGRIKKECTCMQKSGK